MPEASTAQAQSEKAAPVLTEELLATLDKDPSKIHEQPREIRAALRERIGKPPADEAAGDTGAPTPGDKPADAPASDPAAAPAAGEGTASKEEAPKAETVEEKRARLRGFDNEAHAIEQRLAAAARRLEKAKAKEEEFKKANPEQKPADYLEDTHQATIHSKVQELEATVKALQSQLTERDQEEIETLTQSKKTVGENKLFTEIDVLMEDPKFTAARLKKPFAQANQEYGNWLDNLVQVSGITQDTLSEAEKKNPMMALRAKALEKYSSDEAFKASVKIAPPEEMDKLSIWLEAYSRKAQLGGSIKGHLFEILDEQGVLEEGFQRGQKTSARDAANKTADAFKKQTEEIITIAPNDGAARPIAADESLTAASAAAFMQLVKKKQDNRERLTEPERKQLVRVRQFIATGQ